MNVSDDKIQSAELIPMERILLETDGPHLCPSPAEDAAGGQGQGRDGGRGGGRGGRGRGRGGGGGGVCHSGYIPIIAQAIAATKRVPLRDLLIQCRENTRLLYGI
jgi:Tat protein secretion system quality control protein TatD with DNase activity